MMNAEVKTMLTSFIPDRRGRRPAEPLPTLRNSQGEVIPRYVAEKFLGIRRTNGAMKLKRLTNRHLSIIGMHLEGHSLEVIANNMNCTFSTVSRILNDPLAQSILKRVYDDRKGEVHALGGKAIEVVREGLSEEQSIGTRLRAVDRFVKIRQTMIGDEGGEETAEDVIARMLDRATVLGDVNIQVNHVVKKDET